jgi:hypothetical protein
MAVLVIIDIEGGTVEQYEEVDRLAGGTSPGSAPEGLISHTAGVTENGIVVTDVWESADALERAFEERLGPALQQVGVPEGTQRILPVHNHLHGSGAAAGVIMILEIDGMTADDYDQLTAEMGAHAGDGSNHPSVSHVAAIGDSGLVVVDVWGSEEEFGRFAQEEIAPRAGDRMGAIRTRAARVHKHVPVRAPVRS